MDKYHTRQAILKALIDAEPAPLTVSDICSHGLFEMDETPRETVRSELTGLVERGYVRNMRPGRNPLCRITATGRGQIKKEDDLEEFVWGEWASKFQV
ncbi:MAG: hypothetical protein HON70_06290 [Lentisphaerae bacterium]|jgi:hypothetical protein|nr:hypothetical protein [Lentisphaerota bacterium]